MAHNILFHNIFSIFLSWFQDMIYKTLIGVYGGSYEQKHNSTKSGARQSRDR